jgi:hypothetical protein
MNEMIGRPGAGDLHLALAHHCAGRGVFVLVALYAFAFDQVGNVEHHSAAFREPAGHFLIKGSEHAVHLKADCPGTSLALALPRCAFAELGKVFLSDSFGWQMLFNFPAAIIDHNLQVHLGFAVEAFEVALKLSLIGSDGFAKAFIILEDGSEPERQDCRLFEAVSDDPCVVDSGFLIESFCRVMFANDDC